MYLEILLDDCLPGTYQLISDEELKTTEYTAIYVKYIKELNYFGDCNGKNIYISNQRVSLDERAYQDGQLIPKVELIAGYVSWNTIHTFNLYPIDEEYYNYYFEDEEKGEQDYENT